MLSFQPKCRWGHPENYLFLLSKNVFIGSKYFKTNQFNFEKTSLHGTTARWWNRMIGVKEDDDLRDKFCIIQVNACRLKVSQRLVLDLENKISTHGTARWWNLVFGVKEDDDLRGKFCSLLNVLTCEIIESWKKLENHIISMEVSFFPAAESPNNMYVCTCMCTHYCSHEPRHQGSPIQDTIACTLSNRNDKEAP